MNKELENLAEKKGQTYVDLFSSFIDSEGKLSDDFTEDGLHLNGEAYRLWKSLVEVYMEE